MVADDLHWTDRASELAQREIRRFPAIFHWWRGSALVQQGRLAEAERAYEQGDAARGGRDSDVEAAERGRMPLQTIDALHALAMALLLDGQLTEARDVLERAEGESQSVHGRRRSPVRLALHARVALALRDHELALELARDAALWAEETGSQVFGIDCDLALAEVLVGCAGLSESAEIERALARAEERIERSGARLQTPYVHLVRAALCGLREDPEARARELRAAQRLFAEMGATGHAERTARELDAATSA